MKRDHTILFAVSALTAAVPLSAPADNLVTLDSEYLGGGQFEYRLSCAAHPCLERNGLSSFSLAFPGFDSVLLEPSNWQRAPGFPTGPATNALLQWVHSTTNHEDLPCQFGFRLLTQKPAFRIGTCQTTNVLRWNDWAQPRDYRNHVREVFLLNCLVPCDADQGDGSPPVCHAEASGFPSVSILECSLTSAGYPRIGITARLGLPLCVEASQDFTSWLRVGFLQASTPVSAWISAEAATQPQEFYRAVVRNPEFAHPEALASTQWLEQHLGDSTVRIVDSRYGQTDAAFRSGHIPGAVKVDPMVDLVDPGSAPAYLVPTPAQFEALMGRLGLSNTTTVVVYDTSGGLWCARLWWALRYYGHEHVKLLQGGLDKWRAELRPLETIVLLPSRSTFQSEAHPEWRAAFSNVQAAIGNTNIIILDALSQNHHTGMQSDMPGLPPGHIPSAGNFSAPSNLDTGNLLRLPPETLAAAYQQIGITPDKEVITYCGGGYYGAFSCFVLYQLGYEKLRLYDGSWVDWIARGGRIETGN